MATPSNGRERELQAIVRQKDFELEQRGTLLYKTKVAIEDLQQQLAESKQAEERLRDETSKAASQSSLELQKLQQQLQEREADLAGRVQQIAHYDFEARTQQARIQALETQVREAQQQEASLVERLTQVRAESSEQGAALATANSSLRERESHLRSIETTLLKSEAKCRNQEELIAALRSQGPLSSIAEISAHESNAGLDQSNERLREISSRLRDLERTKTATQVELQKARLELDAQQQETATLGVALKEKGAAHLSAKDEASRMQQKIEELERKNRDVNLKLSRLQDENSSLRDGFQMAQASVRDLEREIVQARADLTAEHRERLAVEREWAKKVNAAQLDGLAKITEAEKFAQSKAAEAEQLVANEAQLARAAERIKAFEAADQEQQTAARRAAQKIAALEQAAQIEQQKLRDRVELAEIENRELQQRFSERLTAAEKAAEEKAAVLQTALQRVKAEQEQATQLLQVQHQASLDALKKQLQDSEVGANKRAAELRTAFEEAHGSLRAAERRAAASESAQEEMRVECESSRQEAKDVRAKLRQTQSSLEAAESCIAELQVAAERAGADRVAAESAVKKALEEALASHKHELDAARRDAAAAQALCRQEAEREVSEAAQRFERQEAALTETSKAAKAEVAVLQTELQAAESRARKLDSQLSDAKALAAEQGEVSRTRAAELTERVRELEAVLEQERGRAAYQVKAAEEAALQRSEEARMSSSQRLVSERAQWQEQTQRLERELQKLIGKLAEMKQRAAEELEEAERRHSSRLTEEKQRASHQLEAAEQRHSESLNRAEQAAAARLSEQEQRLRALSSAAEHALAGGRESWKAERHRLEEHWREKVQAVESEGRREKEAMDAKVAAIVGRLQQLAEKESKREKQRSELVEAVAEMRAFGEAETRRRQQLESALQEATTLFKRELAAKNEELADLHAERGQLKLLQSHVVNGTATMTSRQTSPRRSPLSTCLAGATSLGLDNLFSTQPRDDGLPLDWTIKSTSRRSPSPRQEAGQALLSKTAISKSQSAAASPEQRKTPSSLSRKPLVDNAASNHTAGLESSEGVRDVKRQPTNPSQDYPSASFFESSRPLRTHDGAAEEDDEASENCDENGERGDQSPMSAKLKAWQKELKRRLGQAMRQLEPDLLHALGDTT